MGPFVPDIISNEFNLVVALILGVAFGFVLEQAGFSSSRKLTGLFYGTDFTVLRVFFTAGTTAMTGVLLLAAAGLLDTSVIYVNPTFLNSALAGGAIMGVGFVVGGFCPGTSFCGAAVGRIDAMMFVLGGLIGVFGFGEAFPHVQAFYLAGRNSAPPGVAITGSCTPEGTMPVSPVVRQSGAAWCPAAWVSSRRRNGRYAGCSGKSPVSPSSGTASMPNGYVSRKSLFVVNGRRPRSASERTSRAVTPA